MKAPYYIVTAKCDQDGYFIKERRNILKMNTSNNMFRIKDLVCPKCQLWSPITQFEEVKA